MGNALASAPRLPGQREPLPPSDDDNRPSHIARPDDGNGVRRTPGQQEQTIDDESHASFLSASQGYESNSSPINYDDDVSYNFGQQEQTIDDGSHAASASASQQERRGSPITYGDDVSYNLLGASSEPVARNFPERYSSKEEDLADADRNFLEQYRRFQDALRKQKISPFDATLSMTEHLQIVNHNGISLEGTERPYIRELLRYHGWACIQHDKIEHEMRLTGLIISYEDLVSYCKFLCNGRDSKIWSTNKICQAIVSVLKFKETKVDGARTPVVDRMLMDTRALYNTIGKSARFERKERPSLDERRQRGEALYFLEIVKVCEVQHWRVRTLMTFREKNSLTKFKLLDRDIKKMLKKEVERLAVMLTLLKYPTRKIEAKRSILRKVGNDMRLKIAANDRKTYKNPIDVKLSPMEAAMFHTLRTLTSSESSIDDSWQPFKGRDLTCILKATTTDMTGVAVTVTDLRSAAESHVDILQFDNSMESERIQKALSYAEGHSEDTAKMFYKRNGSQSIMKAWTTYVDQLMNIQEAGTDGNDEKFKEIIGKINSSQKRWIDNIHDTIRRSVTVTESVTVAKSKTIKRKGTKRKAKTEWSLEEDNELEKQVILHGEGNWKAILDNSEILQERYKMSTTLKAREGLRDHWRTSHKTKRGRKTIRNYPRHDWTLAEDHALELAVSTYGTSWAEILEETKIFREMYEHMPLRSARSCLKDRWKVLIARDSVEEKVPVKMQARKKRKRKATIRSEPCLKWTSAEDDALELAVSEHGTSWKTILEQTQILLEKYEQLPVEKARMALKDRWRNLLKYGPNGRKIPVKMGGELSRETAESMDEETDAAGRKAAVASEDNVERETNTEDYVPVALKQPRLSKSQKKRRKRNRRKLASSDDTGDAVISIRTGTYQKQKAGKKYAKGETRCGYKRRSPHAKRSPSDIDSNSIGPEPSNDDANIGLKPSNEIDSNCSELDSFNDVNSELSY